VDTRAALAGFAEPRYLHQVRAARWGGVSKYHHYGEDGPLTATTAGHQAARADDLPEALAELPTDRPWRVHFHVPLHAEPEPPLSAATDVLAAALRALYGGARAGSPHVEVETYTWGVLPEHARPADDAGLVAGIAAELRYAHDLLVHSGLSKGD
jgi:hypothetical protein